MGIFINKNLPSITLNPSINANYVPLFPFSLLWYPSHYIKDVVDSTKHVLHTSVSLILNDAMGPSNSIEKMFGYEQ